MVDKTVNPCSFRSSMSLPRSPLLRCARLLGSLACLSVAPASLSAQGGPPSRGSGNDIAVSASYSPAADVERAGHLGEVGISHFSVSYLRSAAVSPDLRLLAGLFANSTDLEIDGSIPLPGTLRQVGLLIGGTHSLATVVGPEWSATLLLRPNVSNAGSGLSSDGFNLPGTLTFGFRQNERLNWDFGIAFSPEGEHVVLPVVGFRWSFAPRWTAVLGYPRTGVAYEVDDALTLRLAFSVQGGNYEVERGLLPSLSDTWLDYRDLRTGVGLDYRVSPALSVSLEAGAVVDREFDYFDRGYKIEGEGAAYFGVSVRGRF